MITIVARTGDGDATALQFTPDTIYQPNVIEEGLEMCGSNGQDAPPNGFQNNRWGSAGPAGSSDVTWHFQDRLQDYDVIDSPASGDWAALPNNGTGGNWSTCIIGSGC